LCFTFPAGKGFPARLAAANRRGKLASSKLRRHKQPMRYLVPLLVLLVAGCAPAPQPTKPSTSAPLLSNEHEHDSLTGMTAIDLAEHLGTPRIQIREGDGLKLQYTGVNCVLDAYLYPPPEGSGVPRVTHIDARNEQGVATSAKACIASIEGR